MYSIFLIALVLVFSYFFLIVNRKYTSSLNLSNAKETAERELAASFIRNAIRQYDIRHSRPDLQLVAEFERLTDEQDALVESYFAYWREASAHAEAHAKTVSGAIPISIKR